MIYVLVMQTILLRHSLSLIIGLRCFQETWSSPGVEKKEHLAMASLNSCFEREGHSKTLHWGALFKNLGLMGWFSAALYNECRVFHRDCRLLHGWPSKEIDSMAGKVFFLIQFIRSHGFLLKNTISWIFSLKNFLFDFHIVVLNTFQLCKSHSS